MDDAAPRIAAARFICSLFIGMITTTKWRKVVIPRVRFWIRLLMSLPFLLKSKADMARDYKISSITMPKCKMLYHQNLLYVDSAL